MTLIVKGPAPGLAVRRAPAGTRLVTGKGLLSSPPGAKGDTGDVGPPASPALVSATGLLDAPAGIVIDGARNAAAIIDAATPANTEFGSLADILTFSRASTAYGIGATGKYVQYGVNTPVLEHDPASGALLGLGLSRGVENLAFPSTPEASWLRNLTISTGHPSVFEGHTSPMFMETTANDTHQLVQNFGTISSGVVYCESWEMELIGRTEVRICLPTSAFTGGPNAIIDVSTSTVTATACEAGYKSMGIGRNGYPRYRFWISATASATASGVSYFRLGAAAYVGDTTKGFISHHVQRNTGPRPGRVVRTTAAAVTGARDIATLAIPAGLITGPVGIFAVFRDVYQTGQTRRLFQVGDGSNERISPYINAPNEVVFIFTNLSNATASENFTLAAEGDRFAIGMTVGNGAGDTWPHNFYADGALLGSANQPVSFDPSLLTEIRLGDWQTGNGAQAMNGTLESLVMVPFAPANALARSTP